MLRPLLAATAAICLPFAATAQSLSNDMTCEEAKAYFAEHRMIETREGDQVIPIDAGVPEAERDSLRCDMGNSPIPNFLKTKDEEQCPVSYQCEG